MNAEQTTGSVRLKGEPMRQSKRVLREEQVSGSVKLKGELMRPSKRVLSVEPMIGRVQLKRELMRLSKTLERRTSDRQCKANKMANETEQEAIERKASNMKQMARKRARPKFNVDAVIEEFVATVKMGLIMCVLVATE